MIKTHSGLQLSPSYADAHAECLGTLALFQTDPITANCFTRNELIGHFDFVFETKVFSFRLTDLFRVDMHAWKLKRGTGIRQGKALQSQELN